MTQRPHRLAALCFADIVGYTELSARNEGEAVALVELLQDVARRAVEERGGRVVKFIGDAVLAEFTSTDDAVRSAVEMRDHFAAEARSRSLGSRDVRVGVHVGDIVTAADGDVYGDGVNVASRIQAAAEPGHVWVSEDVWRQLRQRPEFRFEPRGERKLKGVAAPLALYGVAVQAAASTRPADAERPVLEGGAPKVTRTAAPHKQSVAVLPFTNMSPSAENEYFSDGVTEEILALLTRIEGLKVISRTSIMRYKGTDKPMRQIGEELGVATILEGSVRQAGQRVRITAQLIDAASDEHLWAERYDRELEDIFAIQTDVAERIVEVLAVRLKPVEKARLAERPTDNIEAYQAYLKGRQLLSRRTETTLRQAIEQFRKAVDVDPAFAQGWAGLADASALLPLYSPMPQRAANVEARAAAERALRLDPGLGEPHAALGLVAQCEWKWEEAEREYRRALELAPGYATAHHWYGIFLRSRGRMKEAFATLERARELDPLSFPIRLAIGTALRFDRRHEEAIELYRNVLEMDPGYVPARGNLSGDLLHLRRFGEGIEELEVGARLAPDFAPADWVSELRQGYTARGEKGFWEAYLEGLRARQGIVLGAKFDMAYACAQLGRIDEAFALIDELLAERSPLSDQLAGDPGFDPLLSDPRWEKVLERMGLR